MANKDLRSIQFPGLPDTYVVPEQGGEAGKDGITPTIGANGNWYLGETDTGKPSRGATGADGHSPVVTASKSGKVTTIKVDGKAIATINDGTDGANGKDGTAGSPGANGITPTIGANGNWHLGSVDTGKPSRGATGPAGATPVKGTDYFTAADKAELVTQVIAALPQANGVNF